MPRKTAAATKKKRTQQELKDLNAVQITIVASELNLQRLAALMLFSEQLFEPMVKETTEAPLPFDGPDQELKPVLELNRPAIETAVFPMLEAYLKQHGEEATKKMIESFGAPRLGQLTDEQLLAMYNALAGEAAGE